MANATLGPVFVAALTVHDLNFALQSLVDRIDVLAGLRGAVTIRDRVAVTDPTAAADAVTLGMLTDLTTGYVDLPSAQTITGAKRFDGGLGIGVAPATTQTAIVSLTDNSAGTANDTVQALTNPTDTPLTADALRDNLVAVLIPELRNNFADLAAKVNSILAVLRTFGEIAT